MRLHLHFHLNLYNYLYELYLVHDVTKYLWTAVYIQQQSPTIRYRFTFLLITRLELKCQRSNSAPVYIQITPCCSLHATRVISQNERDYRMYFSEGRRRANRCTPFFRVQPFEKGVMTVKGGYYFSLPWLREAFETLDDLATLPAIYCTRTYTRIHEYRKHTSTEKEGKRRGEGERSTRALLMQFPTTFTFPSLGARMRACMRGTPVHAHGGSSVKRWAIIPDIDLRYCSGFSGSRVFARAIRIFYHCCLPSDHYRSYNRKCPGKTFRAISSRN